MKKLNILLLTIAITVATISLINYANKHRHIEETKTTEDIPERVEVVGGEENAIPQKQGGYIDPYGYQETIPENEVQAYIKEIFGEDYGWGIGVALCESSLNSNAISPSGTYIGLYQFSTSTWNANCDGAVGDWRAQVRCAHLLYDRGEMGRWPNCGMEKGE